MQCLFNYLILKNTVQVFLAQVSAVSSGLISQAQRQGDQLWGSALSQAIFCSSSCPAELAFCKFPGLTGSPKQEISK